MKEAPTTTRPLLLTGAAGKLGSLLRPHLAGRIGGNHLRGQIRDSTFRLTLASFTRRRP